jgi:hypothetical protein
LLGIAKLDMQRQEVKKSLDGVDHEVKISSWFIKYFILLIL